MRRQLRTLCAGICACFMWATACAFAYPQDFDIEPGDVPVWEALERYRDDPLCLRSIDARELTVLPGISLHTAHRIVNIVAMRFAFTFEDIADSACLSVEQMIVLASCTTLDCSARPFVRSAWARLRDRDGRTSIRTDIISEAGRVGGVFDAGAQSVQTGVASTTPTTSSTHTISGWLSATLQETTLHVGAMRAGAGMGLLLGGTGRFGSSISARTGSLSDAPSVCAHTSSYLDGSFRGVAMHHADTSWIAIAGFSQSASERDERAIYTAVQYGHVGLSVLALDYSAPSDSRAANVVRGTSLVSASMFSTWSLPEFDVRSEVAVDNKLASAMAVVAHSVARGRVPRWSCGLRHFSSEYHGPYAASISDASSISNEYGAFVATDARLNSWTLNATLDVHGSLAPRFGSPLPTRGFDIQVSARTRTLDMRARYERDTEGWRPPDDAFTRMHTRTRFTLRCEAGMQVTRHVHVRARIDTRTALFSSEPVMESERTSDFERSSEHGWATFVEAQWQAMSWMSARIRFTLYNSQSIDVAPYFVETDALGAMRTVACSGEGSRMHIALRINPVSFATVSASVVREERTTAPSHPLSGLLQLDIRLPSKP